MLAVPLLSVWLAVVFAWLAGWFLINQPRKPGFLRFRNQGARWAFYGVVLCAVVGYAGFRIYTDGGCEGGFTSLAECTDISGRLGDIAYSAFIYQLLFGGKLVGPIALALIFLQEMVTRIRAE